MEYSLYEAKTHVSNLLQQAQAGESVVITSGREKKSTSFPVERIR